MIQTTDTILETLGISRLQIYNAALLMRLTNINPSLPCYPRCYNNLMLSLLVSINISNQLYMLWSH